MKYEVWQQGTMDTPVMILDAEDEPDAWKILKKIGIRNRAGLMDLVEIDD